MIQLSENNLATCYVNYAACQYHVFLRRLRTLWFDTLRVCECEVTRQTLSAQFERTEGKLSVQLDTRFITSQVTFFFGAAAILCVTAVFLLLQPSFEHEGFLFSSKALGSQVKLAGLS